MSLLGNQFTSPKGNFTNTQTSPVSKGFLTSVKENTNKRKMKA